MFKSKRTKIISTPVEEVLEVEAPSTPKLQVVTNIEFLAVLEDNGTAASGTLTDYDGNVYNYEWDYKSKRIVRLSGEQINSLSWELCDKVLNKYYNPPVKNAEQPIVPQIEQAINKALNPFSTTVKNIETKVEKALTTKAAPAPAPVQAQTAPRPQSVQSAPVDAPAVNVADGDISTNAMRFLQESNVPDLGIDYMSL